MFRLVGEVAFGRRLRKTQLHGWYNTNVARKGGA